MAVPIVVEGALWGVFIIATTRERFADDTEQRLEEFTGLVATAIANAESRSELTASRARIVADSDETRRQIERDIHDGTQQRLVSLGLALRAVQADVPPELDELRAELSRMARGLAAAVEDLQEILARYPSRDPLQNRDDGRHGASRSRTRRSRRPPHR